MSTAIIFCDLWGNMAMIFKGEFVTHENRCRMTSLVTQNCHWFDLTWFTLTYIILYIFNESSWTRAALNTEIPSATKISIWHNMVVLWNIHTVKQSRWWFCLIEIKHYYTAIKSPLHCGCAFPMCTGVETVKQSLISIETNKGMFHSLNAHRYYANK